MGKYSEIDELIETYRSSIKEWFDIAFGSPDRLTKEKQRRLDELETQAKISLKALWRSGYSFTLDDKTCDVIECETTSPERYMYVQELDCLMSLKDFESFASFDYKYEDVPDEVLEAESHLLDLLHFEPNQDLWMPTPANDNA